jgi:uncharacterized protein (TIGR03067 family)
VASSRATGRRSDTGSALTFGAANTPDGGGAGVGGGGDRVEAEGTYELDPSKTPKWIDITGKDRKVLGIYRLDGDKLTICLNEHADGDRPTRFASEPGSRNDLLMVLRRDK